MISQIKQVSIPVRDQDQAIAFYTEKLGFEVAVDMEFAPDQQRWIELIIPGSDTRIALFTPHGHEDRIGTQTNISFSSNAIEATYHQLVERGVQFCQELTKESWGTYALFQDQDGNVFCLSSTD